MNSRLHLSLICASLLLCARAGDAAVFNIPSGDVAALKNAINIANTNGQADVINLAANGTYQLTTIDNAINGPNGLPQLKNDAAGLDLTLNGNGATIRRSSNAGTPEFRIMHVDVDAAVDLDRLVIVNGAGTGAFPAYRGAGILVTSATLKLTNCAMSSHVAREGAAIYSSRSALTLSDCAFEENQAEQAGAIFNLEGSVTATDSSFVNNIAYGSASANTPGRGGAIHSRSENTSAALSLTRCTFIGNRILGLAQGSGGAIYNQRGSTADATVALANCTFENNFGAEASGGAIASNALVSLTDCTLRANYSRTGGAILQTGGSLDVRGSTFEQNAATRNAATNSGGTGGAIMTISQTTLTVVDSAFRNNEAGTAAGAIQNGGRASITNTDVSDNAAVNFGGAIVNHGQLTLLNTELVGNDSGTSGGALYTAQEATLRRCLIEDNSSVSAGGIANSGTLTIDSSTLHNNRATGPSATGGAIGTLTGAAAISTTIRDSTLSNNTAANGAGIHNIGDLKLTNSTLSGNAASAHGGGLLNRDGTSLIVAATFYGNTAPTGGGICNEKFGAESTVTLLSSILQAGATGANIVNATGGTFFSSGYNLSSDAAGGDGNTGPGGLLNNSDDARNTNPNLGPLQNNGGVTHTHALLFPSAAIDTGDQFIQNLPFRVKNDQRGAGFPRQIGERVDKGAVESGVSLLVTTVDDHNDGACTPTDCTLREAIVAVNLAGIGNVSFAAGVTGVIQLNEPLEDVRANLTLQGPGAELLTVRRNSGGDYRIFTINNGSSNGPRVTISGLTIGNGKAPEGSYPANSGGGIFNERGVLTVSRCVMIGNRAAGVGSYGGAIFNEEGTVIVRESTLTGNVAVNGGGIASIQGFPGAAFVRLDASTLHGNTAEHGNGGAVYNEAVNASTSANFLLNNSTLSGNTATASGFAGGVGGAIYNSGRAAGLAEMSVGDCTLHGNNAPNTGGIYNNNFSAAARVSLVNTIVKRGNAGANFLNSSGEIISHGHNISDDAAGGLSGTGPGGFLNATGDMRETDPLLGPLQNNGGPTTTHALLGGSPAINAGQDTIPSQFDQRGFLKVGANDIGAFEVGGAAPQPPAPLSAVSRKIHGSAGAFDIDLLAQPLRTECRNGGATGNYQLVLTFAQDVTVSDLDVRSSNNQATATLSYNGPVLTIDLANVANAQTIPITLVDVSDGDHSGDIVIPFRVLLGDTNGNGSLTASDIGQAKTQSGQAVTAANFRSDVTANGAINSSDVSLVKSTSGTQLPAVSAR